MGDYLVDRRGVLKAAGGIGLLSVTGGLLASCGGSSSSSTSTTSAVAKKGGSAIMSMQSSPVDMDPGDGKLYSSLQVYQNIFSSLLSVDENYVYHPNLASAWQQEDAKAWRFDLVENAVFQNGEPLTAQDVAFTVNRIKEHPLGSFFKYFGNVEILNKYSCRMHLTQPYGPMEATVAFLLDIVNEKAVTENDPKAKPIGCGPYQMSEWVRGSHVTLKRWDKYFKTDRPYLDEIRMQAVSSPTIALTGLRSGQSDWIESVPAQQVASLTKGSNPGARQSRAVER